MKLLWTKTQIPNKWKLQSLLQMKQQLKNLSSSQTKVNLEDDSSFSSLDDCSPMLPPQSVTMFMAELISNSSSSCLSEVVRSRSQRMILDTLGVGIFGYQSETTRTVKSWAENLGYFKTHGDPWKTKSAVIWGSSNMRAPIGLATYLNGISVHSMDFDDTWHPATHPSGPVLPAILSLFHPPAVVGVMGSAAAAARLLQLGPHKTKHALAIAASFAGAPMANAGTQCKPLHAGKSARFGLEAALMADQGMEGNENILDTNSGFSVYFEDYSPDLLLKAAVNKHYILHTQDVAIKRFPAHLGMHWAIDATMDVREQLLNDLGDQIPYNDIKDIVIVAPSSKYIDRPFPQSQHEARHSFQFNVASALLDGTVNPNSFVSKLRSRTKLEDILRKCRLHRKKDNEANFNKMYVEVAVILKNNKEYRGRCETPYGHWRKPLTDLDVQRKFLSNTESLPSDVTEAIIRCVMEPHVSSDELLRLLRH
ncbi:cis-aconitate decarboxylase-like [Argonauta hians]